MRFGSKEELVGAIKTAHEELLVTAGSIPRQRYHEKGVWGDDWTVKDLFAHLTEWEQMFLGWYRQGLTGGDPALPADGYKWNQTPALNRAIWRKHKDSSWKQVQRRFTKSYREIVALAEGLPEKQLLSPGHFRWTGRLPLASYLGPNTSSHYRTATKILKRWIRQQRIE